MATQAEIAAMNEYLVERKKHRARRTGQVVGAYSGVASGRDVNAPAALDARDPYPDLMSEMEKIEASKGLNEQLDASRQNLYNTAMGNLQSQYTTDSGAARAGRSDAAATSRTNAQMRDRANQRKMNEAASRDMADASLEGTTEAAVRKSGLGDRQGRRNADGSYADDDDEGAYDFSQDVGEADLEYPVTSPSDDFYASSPVIDTTSQGRNLDKAYAAIAEAEDIHFKMGDGPKASAAYRNAEELARLGGTSVSELVAGTGVSEQHYEAINNYNRHRKDETQEMRDEGLMAAGAGSASQGAIAAGQEGIRQNVYGDVEENYLMPGVTNVVPETDTQKRYVQMLDAINDMPENPPVQEMKAHIMDQSYYKDYVKERGYETAPPDMVWKEYTRETKGIVKQSKKQFREDRARLIREGVVKARSPIGSPRATGPTPSAGIAGGADTQTRLGSKAFQDLKEEIPE